MGVDLPGHRQTQADTGRLTKVLTDAVWPPHSLLAGFHGSFNSEPMSRPNAHLTVVLGERRQLTRTLFSIAWRARFS